MDISNFYEFIYQRQLIWHKRHVLKEAAPWTIDPVLTKYKFCNVYRELDASTLHLKYWVLDNPEVKLKDKIFNIILFRFFNVSNFYGDVLMNRALEAKSFKSNQFIPHFDAMQKLRVLIKNDAIHVCGTMFPGHPIRNQILMTMEQVGRGIEMITHSMGKEQTLQNYFNILQYIKGVGPFLAYQMAQDIGYIEKMAPTDLNKFVHVGPGAVEGLKILCLGTDAIHSYTDRCKYLFEMQGALLPLDWSNIYYKNPYYKSEFLSLGNIQHSICEYRKKCKLETNPKARKRLYKGALSGK